MYKHHDAPNSICPKAFDRIFSTVQIGLKSLKILARIQGNCTINARARPLSLKVVIPTSELTQQNVAWRLVKSKIWNTDFDLKNSKEAMLH